MRAKYRCRSLTSPSPRRCLASPGDSHDEEMNATRQYKQDKMIDPKLIMDDASPKFKCNCRETRMMKRMEHVLWDQLTCLRFLTMPFFLMHYICKS